jgi:hypothetical protein
MQGFLLLKPQTSKFFDPARKPQGDALYLQIIQNGPAQLKSTIVTPAVCL